jgi:hypothetical protein
MSIIHRKKHHQRKKAYWTSSFVIFAQVSVKGVRKDSVEPVKDLISHNRLQARTKKANQRTNLKQNTKPTGEEEGSSTSEPTKDPGTTAT